MSREIEYKFQAKRGGKEQCSSLQSHTNSTIFEYTMSETHLGEIDKGLRGAPEPELTAEQESWESFDDLITEKPDPEKIEGYLGTALIPFRGGKGNEHNIFQNEEGTKLIKLDKVKVDPEISEERFLVHNIYHDLFPEHLPNMEKSFSTEGGSGIVVEKIAKHPDLDQAMESVKQGNEFALSSITKKSFRDVIFTCHEAGIPLDYDSTKSTNYVINPEGTQVFIDDFWTSGKELVDPKAEKNIKSFMERREFAPEKVDSITKKLDALKMLSQSEKAA